MGYRLFLLAALCFASIVSAKTKMIRDEFGCSVLSPGMQRSCQAITQTHGVYTYEDSDSTDSDTNSAQRVSEVTSSQSRESIRSINESAATIASSSTAIAVILGAMLVLDIVTLVVVAKKM